MDITEAYRIKVLDSDYPSESGYTYNYQYAEAFATMIVGKFNSTFETERTLSTITDSGYTHYYFPLFEYDGSDAVKICLSVKGNSGSIDPTDGFVFQIDVIWINNNSVSYLNQTFTTNYNIKDGNASYINIIGNTLDTRNNKLPFFLTFLPIPNGYAISTLANANIVSGTSSGVIPLYNYYVLKCTELDGSEHTGIICKGATSTDPVYAQYPFIDDSNVESIYPFYGNKLYETSEGAFACRVFGEYTFDIYALAIKSADGTSVSPTIFYEMLSSNHTSENRLLVPLFSKDGKTYGTPMFHSYTSGSMAYTLLFENPNEIPTPTPPPTPREWSSNDFNLNQTGGLLIVNNGTLYQLNGGTNKYFLEYNNGSWSYLTSPPRTIVTATSYNNKIYAFYYYAPSIYCAVYDNGSWTTSVVKNASLWGEYTASACTYDGKIHLVHREQTAGSPYYGNKYITYDGTSWTTVSDAYNMNCLFAVDGVLHGFYIPNTSTCNHYTFNGTSWVETSDLADLLASLTVQGQSNAVIGSKPVMFDGKLHIFIHKEIFNPSEYQFLHYVYENGGWTYVDTLPFWTSIVSSSVEYNNDLIVEEYDPNMANIVLDLYKWS